MNEILREFAPSSLIGAIETNTIESFLTWTKWDKLALRQDGDDLWIESEIPFFIYNLVLRSDGASAGPESVIDAAISRATSRKVPMAWWVGPSDPVPDMGQRLEMKGFFHAATLNGMAVDLQALVEPASMPQGFTISKVNDSEDLETWCQIMTEVSEFSRLRANGLVGDVPGYGNYRQPVMAPLSRQSRRDAGGHVRSFFGCWSGGDPWSHYPAGTPGTRDRLRNDPIAPIGRPKPRLSGWYAVFL